MPKNKLTVLVAEDEADIREMYSVALADQEYAVLEASNGKKALDLLEEKKEKVDLILLDIVMPALDGFEILEKIKSRKDLQKTPVIFCTNLDNIEDRNEAMRLGADGYFVKSQHTPKELMEIVGRRLASLAK